MIDEIESNIQDSIATTIGAYPIFSFNRTNGDAFANVGLDELEEGCGLIVVDWQPYDMDVSNCRLEYLTIDYRGLVMTFRVNEHHAPVNNAAHLEITMPPNTFETNLKTPIHRRYDVDGVLNIDETIAGNALQDIVLTPSNKGRTIFVLPKITNLDSNRGVIVISNRMVYTVSGAEYNTGEGYPVFTSKKKLKKLNGAFAPVKGGLWWSFDRTLMQSLVREHRLSRGINERNIFVTTPIFVMNKQGIWVASLDENGLINKVEALSKQPNRKYVGRAWPVDSRTYAITFGEYSPYYMCFDDLYEDERAIYEIMVKPALNSKHPQVRAAIGYTIVKGRRTNMVVRLYDYHTASSYIVEESAVSRLPYHAPFKGETYLPVERLERFTKGALIEENDEMTPEEKKIIVRWLYARTVDLARRGDELPYDEHSLATKLGLTGE